MKIRILSAAKRDLIRAKRFYEGQDTGLGDYFLDSLSSDIESLKVYAGIHRKVRTRSRFVRAADCRVGPTVSEGRLERPYAARHLVGVSRPDDSQYGLAISHLLLTDHRLMT